MVSKFPSTKKVVGEYWHFHIEIFFDSIKGKESYTFCTYIKNKNNGSTKIASMQKMARNLFHC